jgi:hypothetical protein
MSAPADGAVPHHHRLVVRNASAQRMCKISVMPPAGNNLSGEPPARKPGDVCTKPFALP